MQAWTRNSSVSSQALYHRATAPPLLFEEMQCSFITPVMPYGIASYFVCCMFFFFVFFFTATYVDPASSGSRVIRLPPSMWRECNEPMQTPF